MLFCSANLGPSLTRIHTCPHWVFSLMTHSQLIEPPQFLPPTSLPFHLQPQRGLFWIPCSVVHQQHEPKGACHDSSPLPRILLLILFLSKTAGHGYASPFLTCVITLRSRPMRHYWLCTSVLLATRGPAFHRLPPAAQHDSHATCHCKGPRTAFMH